MKNGKKDSLSSNPEFERRVKEARVHRLSVTLVNLVDLKVKGIITNSEYQKRKRQLLGF